MRKRWQWEKIPYLFTFLPPFSPKKKKITEESKPQFSGHHRYPASPITTADKDFMVSDLEAGFNLSYKFS